MIAISINGTPRHFDTDISVATLLEHMQLVGKRVALEHNGAIVPRSQFPQQMLANGDSVEIVVAVGGG